MVNKISPTFLGAFVVGAILCMVAGVLLFSGGKFFTEKVPFVLFFDEPSAGLDPLSSRRLDDLILELRESLGATVVVVTHELASIFTIGDTGVFLDADTKTMLAVGNPKTLRDTSPEPKIRAFLTRGEADAPPAA